MSWTYTKAVSPNANTEKLIDLWKSFGATGLFRLEIEYEYCLKHVYYLKDTDIKLRASSNGPEHYMLEIFNGEEQISSSEFWEILPKDIKKVLVYHLDQIIE